MARYFDFSRLTGAVTAAALAALSLAGPAHAQESPASDDVMSLFTVGADQTEALRVNDAIYQATGFGNTFMVTTSEGNVIIDTSLAFNAPRHKKLLTAVSDAPVRYIVLTHAHGDHTGGVPLWKGPDTEVIAQAEHEEFIHYQHRLRAFFADRNADQFPELAKRFNAEAMAARREADVDNLGGNVLATILFEDEYAFTLGGLTFQVMHTPGETYDHATVWIPEYKAAFTGDNFYGSFPNIYTLRGTKPRWALDYIVSLDKVLALQPEILLPSHGQPIHGAEAVRAALTRYRDAIRYVHDATVAGMNAGTDVFTLMREIALPEDLDIGEGYGKISWSVRGIYEGYVGYYDGHPNSLYSVAPYETQAELVALAGGAETVAAQAAALANEDQLERALALAEAAATADAASMDALQTKLDILNALESRSSNANEKGWLRSAIADTEGALLRLKDTK